MHVIFRVFSKHAVPLHELGLAEPLKYPGVARASRLTLPDNERNRITWATLHMLVGTIFRFPSYFIFIFSFISLLSFWAYLEVKTFKKRILLREARYLAVSKEDSDGIVGLQWVWTLLDKNGVPPPLCRSHVLSPSAGVSCSIFLARLISLS